VTVFRDDLGAATSVDDMAKLSSKKRRAALDTIRDACRDYIAGPLNDRLGTLLAHDTNGAGRIVLDEHDPDGQTLLVHYPAAEPDDVGYVRPVVRIESGAKSALDPHRAAAIHPYVADDVEDLDLTVAGVTTVDASRTFWDKVVIAHGLRRWHDRRGVLRQDGQRMSRHYYDLHCLLGSDAGRTALADRDLGADCVRHARMFFDRTDYDLASAAAGNFAVAPRGAMIDALRRDYDATRAMIFGTVPAFDDILESVERIDGAINWTSA